MLGDRKTAVLRGGAPWGFRLSGGVFTPVYIIKVVFISLSELRIICINKKRKFVF